MARDHPGRPAIATRAMINAKPQVKNTKPPALQGVSVERTTGFEPATLTLAR